MSKESLKLKDLIDVLIDTHFITIIMRGVKSQYPLQLCKNDIKLAYGEMVVKSIIPYSLVTKYNIERNVEIEVDIKWKQIKII